MDDLTKLLRRIVREEVAAALAEVRGGESDRDVSRATESRPRSEHLTNVEADPVGRLLSIGEVAKWINVTPKSIYNWRTVGRGPSAVKIGGRLRWRQEDVAVWISQQR